MKHIKTWGIAIIVLALAIAGIVWLAKQKSQTSASDLTPSVTADEHIKGELTAPVVLVEFSDFQCPACAVYYPIVKKLIAENGERVRLVYRHFPLPQHIHARAAAYAAEAAGLQGKFWEMHDMLFLNQTEWAQSVTPEVLFLQYAKSIGLNEETFQADSESDVVKEHVKKNYDSGIASRVNATPSFFLNGTFIESPRSYDEFLTVVDAAAKSASQ